VLIELARERGDGLAAFRLPAIANLAIFFGRRRSSRTLVSMAPIALLI
jgi:hypothetical protein